MSECCEFCMQIAGQREHNALLSLVGSAWAERPVLAERQGAVVMPSIGALATGHVLLCPKEHARSVASVDQGPAVDIEELATEWRRRLAIATGLPIHAFEHGSSSVEGGRVACSVEHAHLHLVPAAVEIRPRLRELLDWTRLEIGTSALRDTADGREYLFYEAPDGERMLATTESGFDSQLLRIVLAEALGRPESWNWREHPARLKVEKTVSLLETSLVASDA